MKQHADNRWRPNVAMLAGLATLLAVCACRSRDLVAATAVPSAPKQQSAQELALAAKVRQILAPSLKRLDESPSVDAATKEILRRVQVTARGTTGEDPVAFSTLEKEVPYVTVDAAEVMDIIAVAQIVSLIDAGYPDTAGLMRNVAEASGWRLGLDGPVVFDIPSGIDRASSDLLFDASKDILHSAIAWLMLHEIAHLRLGHLRAPASTYPARLKQELEADQWSIERVNAIGFSIPSLEAYFAGKQLVDVTRGTPLPLDHPSWRERRRASFQFASTHAPPAKGMQILQWLGFTSGPSPKIEQIILAYPSDPAASANVRAMLGRGSQTVPGAVENDGSRATLYFRERDSRHEVVLSNRFAHAIRASFTTVGGNTRTTRTLDFRRASLASDLDRVAMGGLTLRQMFEHSQLEHLTAPLDSMRLDPHVDAEVRVVLRMGAEAEARLTLVHAKGAFEYDDYLPLLLAQSRKMTSTLSALLGPKMYARYRHAIASDPYTQVSMDRILGERSETSVDK